MKVHYAQCDKATESNSHDYWSCTICGIEETESSMTEIKREVTCKRCLKAITKIEKEQHSPTVK